MNDVCYNRSKCCWSKYRIISSSSMMQLQKTDDTLPLNNHLSFYLHCYEYEGATVYPDYIIHTVTSILMVLTPKGNASMWFSFFLPSSACALIIIITFHLCVPFFMSLLDSCHGREDRSGASMFSSPVIHRKFIMAPLFAADPEAIPVPNTHRAATCFFMEICFWFARLSDYVRVMLKDGVFWQISLLLTQ